MKHQTAYECLIQNGYELQTAGRLIDDRRYELTLVKGDEFVTLIACDAPANYNEMICRGIAELAHNQIEQKRKYTGEPYINHPKAVVEIVRSVEHTEAMVCAAWLHDVVEDTPITLACLERMLSEQCTSVEFAKEVVALVEMLTDVSKPEYGNRAVRKEIDRQHTAQASPEAKTIKLADLIDNTQSIVEHDPDFAKVYLQEKRMLLKVLTQGDKLLFRRAFYLAADEQAQTALLNAPLDEIFVDVKRLPNHHYHGYDHVFGVKTASGATYDDIIAASVDLREWHFMRDNFPAPRMAWNVSTISSLEELAAFAFEKFRKPLVRK